MTRPPACPLALMTLLAAWPASAAAQGAPSSASPVYEYVYPYNTADLIENHFLVLDTSGGEPRGWYYGTSDEFDQAREGYLPGFFVAPVTALRLSETEISFTLNRPARFFTAPVPLEFRDAEAVPPGRLEVWDVPLPPGSRDYSGRRTADEIALDVPGGPRVFRRR